MAKGSMTGGPLIGALFNSVTPPAQDKKRARKPRKSQTTHGEKSVTEPAQQHGELAAYKEPTPAERIKDGARRAKEHATARWIDGHMTTTEHMAIHRRANHVLTNRRPEHFKGKTGEQKIKAKGW